MVVLLRWLSSCMRRKKPKRPRNKGQEEKEEEAERVLMSFNSSQRVWCKRLLKTTTAAAGMAVAMAAAWCGGGRRCCFASFLCDLFCFTEGQKLKTMKTTPLLVAVSCKALPMAKATEGCPPAFAHPALLVYSAAAW